MRQESLVMNKVVKFNDLHVVSEVIQLFRVEWTVLAGLQTFHLGKVVPV